MTRLLHILCSVLIPFCTAVVALPSPLAARERPFSPGSARAQAMGMTWIACTAPEDAAFFNPAWLASEDERFTIIRLRTGANSDGLALLFGQTGDDIRMFGSDSGAGIPPRGFMDTMTGFDAVYETSGPLFLSYKGEGFGIGLYSSSRGGFNAHGTTLPTATLEHDFDIGAIAGLALPITLDEDTGLQLLLGGTIKYLVRIRHIASEVPLTEASRLVDPFAFSGDFRIGQAIGSDLGITWRTPYFSVGVVWYDWFGTTLSWNEYSGDFKTKDTKLEDTHITPMIGAGIAWTPPDLFGLPSWLFSNTQIAIDVRGFLEEEDSFFKMLHIGFESTFLHFATIRLGINAGYPTCGLAFLLFGGLNLEYTLATEERGRLPGQNPLTLHTISVTLML